VRHKVPSSCTKCFQKFQKYAHVSTNDAMLMKCTCLTPILLIVQQPEDEQTWRIGGLKIYLDVLCGSSLLLSSNILPLILMFETDVDLFQFLPWVHGNKFALMSLLRTYNVCELAFCADRLSRNASILEAFADEMVPTKRQLIWLLCSWKTGF